MDKQDEMVKKSFLSNIGRGIGGYLTDWRNLLGHALLGFVFLGLAIWAPIDIGIKLAVIACLIVFNVIRMKRKAEKSEKTANE